MRKLQKYMGSLAVVGILASCSLNHQDIVKEERNNLETKVETAEKSQIIVPPRIYEKAISDIDWIFEKGYADEISYKDFDHFHILIPSYKLQLYPNLDNSEMINDPNVVLLYHTREFPSKKIERPERNITSTLEGEPRMVRPEWFGGIDMSMSMGEGIIPRSKEFKPFYSKYTVYPRDLGCRGILQVDFKIDPDGNYQLKDGINLKFKPYEMTSTSR